MVLPASHKVSRVSWYSGSDLESSLFTYRAITFYGGPFQVPSASKIYTTLKPHNPPQNAGFRLFPFRSPLLRESNSFSFPRATKMFQFARYPLRQMAESLEFIQGGYPIRKSPDQRLFDTSPRPIAAYHVLLRLFKSRHPPNAHE